MTDTTEPADVYEALYLLQSERIVLAKDQDGQVGSQKTKYADLVQANEVILPRLFDLGLLWLTSPTLRMIPGPNGSEDPRFVLDWTLRHVPSKTSIDGTYPLMDAGTAMKAGSAITYARRYALIAVTNAVAQDEDDDGRGGQGRTGRIQRESVPLVTAPPAGETAQRRTPPASREKARPAVAPPAPEPRSAPTSGAPRQGSDNDRFAEDGTRLMSKKQLGLLGVLTTKAGITDRGDKLAVVNDMIGRPAPIGSANDLTFEEGRGIIDAFQKAIEADADTAAATVIDIYRRTSGPAPTAEQAETGHPPTKRTTRPAKRAAVPARTLNESIVGIPDPDGGPAPWEDEPPVNDDWPDVVQPGQQ